jgi:hypothetical protein
VVDRRIDLSERVRDNRRATLATLSVCCLTRDAPERLRAIFDPLRAFACEFVIAADSRVAAAERRAYADLADRVFEVDFPDFVETHLAWVYAECSGDWILRLDGDEVPSAALLRVLPDLLKEPAIRQYWSPRRWVAPDGEGWLDELPWAPDYQNRLIRNDGHVAFSGRLHSGAEPAFPARDLREAIYHLVCALETTEERLARSQRYELMQPHRIAPGGGPFNATYYVPERSAHRQPIAFPLDDRPTIAAALGRCV